MGNFLALIAERVINQPLMILPEKLAVVALILEGRINIDASDFKGVNAVAADDIDATQVLIDVSRPQASRFIGERRLKNPSDPKSGFKPYKMTSGGAAIIPVHGSLVNKGSFMDALSGVTSYESIKFQMAEAAADPEVGSILTHIDSGGGEAVGAFGAADAVRAATRQKPVYAVTDGLCCSAAYAIASGATRIIAARDSIVGSIGTAMLHLDHSKLLADVGIKPTLFVTGKKKQQGHPFFELTDEVKGDLRDYIDRTNANFIRTVSDHRGIAADKILAMQAGVFIGAEAIAQGLIDEVGTVDGALAELHSRTSFKPRGRSMTMFTQAELDQAVATAKADGHKAGHTEGHAAGVKEGVTAERARFKAVQSSENYKGREISANHVLHNTAMTAEEIQGVLSGIPAPPPVAAAPPVPTGERSKDAPGGLVQGSQGAEDPKPEKPKSEFEQGQAIASSLPESMRRKK